MEFQQILNFQSNALSEPYDFRTKGWADISDYARRMYNTHSQIKYKINLNPKLKSGWCGYSDAYILVKGAITVVGVGPTTVR